MLPPFMFILTAVLSCFIHKQVDKIPPTQFWPHWTTQIAVITTCGCFLCNNANVITFRLGVDTGGYEDRGVESLRCNLFAYLCRNSSTKAGHPLQIATASALLRLLPFDFETLFETNLSLPVDAGNFVYENFENLRKWLSGLDKDKRDLLCSISRRDVYKKKKL